MTLRVGILGGTFNPIHTGHLLMAESILVKLKLDYILFIPCAIPAIKRRPKLKAARHRLEMVTLAIKGNPRFKVSTIELNRGGRSYSVDTLEELTKIYKNAAAFFFIIGSDNLTALSGWKDPDRLLELCTLVVAARPGYLLAPLEKVKGIRKAKIVNVPTLSISSTDIRNLVRKGKSIKYLVPEEVRKYILKNRLYSRNSIKKSKFSALPCG